MRNCDRCASDLQNPHLLEGKNICGKCFQIYEAKKHDLVTQYTDKLVDWAKLFLQPITITDAPIEAEFEELPDEEVTPSRTLSSLESDLTELPDWFS